VVDDSFPPGALGRSGKRDLDPRPPQVTPEQPCFPPFHLALCPSSMKRWLFISFWLGIDLAGLTAGSELGTGDRWQPFRSVRRPSIPPVAARDAGLTPRNPIDHFLAVEWITRGLKPRPEASREVLLRRLYIDLIGLNPSPEEQSVFLRDNAPDAYERLLDRLLCDPRHGERWARHWMDVWRYSDWAGWSGGNQIRDSKPHIWRWRDWIVEALNTDKPYDRMILEMLAADELAPDDPEALRATGFLVRNYKMLSRERWLEDTVKHTSQAFLGITMGCAQCHDHRRDPITQREYFQIRAIFEPHQVRTDRVPGELDRTKDGLVRAYDAKDTVTWLYERGDERHPLTNEVIQPGVPSVLGGRYQVEKIELPRCASHPDERDFVLRDTMAAAERAVKAAEEALAKAEKESGATADRLEELKLGLDVERKEQAALLGVWKARQKPDATEEALKAAHQQRVAAVARARLQLHRANGKVEQAKGKDSEALKKEVGSLEKARKELADARAALEQPLDSDYTLPPGETYPSTSTGRRLAFARWLTDSANPLVARVAVNHVWLRHFGRGIVATPANFGSDGARPTHPELLDWLAAEFMKPSRAGVAPWSMRELHRLICTSAAYRMASTSDDSNLAVDPDNHYLWRMNSRRLEAEAVRDNLLNAGGKLDLTQGGPDIDYGLALTSLRRSLYLRNAAEKQAEFLQIFDGPSVTECYQRHNSVMPQQALALSNSELALGMAKELAQRLTQSNEGDRAGLVGAAFRNVLARPPTSGELEQCLGFLSTPAPSSSAGETAADRRAANLVLVLMNHNDFVTVR